MDNAGNTSTESAGNGFTIDAVGPAAPTGVGLGSVPNNLTDTPTITFTAAVDALSGTASHEVKIIKTSDSAVIRDWVAHTSGGTVTGLTLVDATQYSALVRGVDVAGNPGTDATVNWTTIEPASCAQGNVPIGTVCPGGALYAGQFDGGKYMVMPSGCSDIPGGAISGGNDTNNYYALFDLTPTCSGGTDSLLKRWNDGSSNWYEIPGVENFTTASQASSSSYRGSVNQIAIVEITEASQGGFHAAARYCDKLSYGGYTDWYLPSKSELMHLYCYSNAGSHNTSYPQENVNCASYGGKQTGLTGFAQVFYWSSTEWSNYVAWGQWFSSGHQSTNNKGAVTSVRCLRRY